MKWNKVTLKTKTDAVDLVIDMLSELGVEGAQIVDNIPLTEADKKAMFIDILPELEPDDGTAELRFYMDLEIDLSDLTTKIQHGLEELSAFIDVGSREIQTSETDDQDWINNWKEFFKPFRVDDTIVIKPTWEKLDQVSEQDLVIEIDPGTAFGTGSHETTKLCILQLKKYIKEETRLLDVGCGSGILSIIGLKLGAKDAVGIDVDPNAVAVTLENAEVNSIAEDTFKVYSGNIIEDGDLQETVGLGCYDVVVANILADVIIPLSSEVGRHLKPDGVFISSGIINTKKEEVKEAIEKNGFKIIDITEMGNWVSITSQLV